MMTAKRSRIGRLTLQLVYAVFFASSVSLAAPPTTAPANEPAAVSPETTAAFATVSAILKHPGILHDSVFTVTFPRDDLYVTVERMEVPTAAGIESRFNFYRCSCGKMSVLGEFIVTDYEANDVIDALRTKQFTVASLAPFLLNEHPRLVSIHFKAEGTTEELANTLKDALSWTGKQREAPAGERGH